MSTEDLLSQLSRFFSRYLSCSEDQLTILVLWTLHTHCFAAAQTTPYLDISSTEWQSGKTVCLRLLSLVCADPWLATGINSTVLVRRLAAGRPTLLLDERETIFSPAAYGKVRGLLSNGAHRGGTFSVAPGSKPVQDLDVFCPKAFAGNAPLPAALSQFCIPIVLLRNENYGYFNKLRLSQANETGPSASLRSASRMTKGKGYWGEGSSKSNTRARDDRTLVAPCSRCVAADFCLFSGLDFLVISSAKTTWRRGQDIL